MVGASNAREYQVFVLFAIEYFVNDGVFMPRF